MYTEQTSEYLNDNNVSGAIAVCSRAGDLTS